MNFYNLVSVVFNDDTRILQNTNIVKVNEMCVNGHVMSIKDSRCHEISGRKEKSLRVYY